MSLDAALPTIALVLATGLGDPIVTPTSTCFVRASDSASFEFASNPWLNLYNFLVKEAKQARGIDDEGLGARGYVAEDTAAIRALSATEAAEWSNAVDFFSRQVLPDRLGIDSLVQNVNTVLTLVSPNDDLAAVPLHPELRRVLQDVIPIYRSAWWPTHDARNQRWIASMRSQLAGREECLRQRAEMVFRSAWPSPVHVDATVYASWFGAYSIHHPTRVTVTANAQGSQGAYGLEVLLHETAHGMLDRLESALAGEATRQSKRLPPELSHFVLFYTAGALMKEQQPDYLPFAERFGIWTRNDRTRRYRAVIEQEWQPYLSGERTFADAICALVQRIR